MKKTLLLLSLFCVIFAKEFNYAPEIKNPNDEKSIVIVIPSYNNREYLKDNLQSVFCQNYKNFRVIYTNDASTDETGRLVKEYILKYGQDVNVTLIENEENKGALYNLYHMIYSCKDDEIILILDGDDKLFHENVLERINRAYQDERVWMTYGMDVGTKKSSGHSKPTLLSVLKEGNHRKLRYRWSHPRTFYAGLFKQIPLDRLQYEEEFYHVANDVAIGLFLLDLAREHVFYIKDVLYVYNMENPNNDYKKN
ncbi:MAG: hypothetical protein S4CHLAM20_10310 [Chlamydiia bacterium]|nr:hypothetical protein [Chlamydiia bacterium]